MRLTLSGLWSGICGILIVGVIAGTNYVNAVSQQVVENATTQSRVNSVNSIDVNKEVVAEKPFVEASTQLSERVAQSDPIPTPSTVESLVPPPTDVKTEQGQQNPTLTDTFGLRLSRDGLLSGRLKVVDSISHGEAIASELSVKFIQNGRVVNEPAIGLGGVFQAKGLKPGVYTLRAKGADGFYLGSVVILPGDDGVHANAIDPLQVDAAVLHPSNLPLVDKLVHQRFPRKQYTAVESRVSARSWMSPEPTGRAIHTPVLNLRENGQVSLRLTRIDPESFQMLPATGEHSVFLVRGGSILGRSTPEGDSVYSISGVTEGDYSLIVVSSGSKGAQSLTAAMGVRVEGRTGRSKQSGVVSRFESPTIKLASKLSMQEDPPTNINAAPPGDGDNGDGQTNAGGPGGGGTGGFGGGGAGGGGLGLGLGLAVGAGLGVGLSNNDDGGSDKSPALP